MSKHDFTLRVTVLDAELDEHNRRAERNKDRTVFPNDPSEWGDTDLQIALDEELATFEIIDYSAVASPSEIVAGDAAARKEARA